MANSISATSNIQTPTNSTPATFKAGDAVLCLSLFLSLSLPLIPSAFLLIGNPYGKGGK